MDFWRRTNWKIASMVRVWYLISAIVIAGGVVAWALLGLNLGIDFTGGSLYKFQTEQAVAGTSDQDSKVIGDVRAILGEMQVAHSQIQVAGNNLILIRSQITSHEAALEQADKILAALNEKMGPTAGKITLVGNELVGPVIGAQLKYNALLALIIGNLLILIFLTVRYEFRVATACIVALIHDVLVMIGGMAIARAEVNSEFIAAMLTIVGFSVTDSVVIFDRIRENKRLHRSADLETITNASLLQTMHRSINTVLVVLLTLFSLFFLGGSTIHPFVLALLIGMTTGMYSSIFIASPLVVSWDKWSLSRRRKSAAVAPSRQRLVVAGGSAPDTSGGEEQPTEGLSAEQAMRRAQNSAQEAKRAERRERRKSSSKGGKRRY